MKLKNLLFVFCLALLAGCQKDPDTRKYSDAGYQ